MSQLFSGKDISNVILRLWADVKYHVPTGLVFRRRRAVFILLTMPPTSKEGGVGDVAWLIQASA